MGTWMKYANWEESQKVTDNSLDICFRIFVCFNSFVQILSALFTTTKEFERARSVYERAITVDYKYQPLWLAYAEMEMRNKFVNHACNVW